MQRTLFMFIFIFTALNPIHATTPIPDMQELNFDTIEESALEHNVFDSIVIKPPSPFMIFLRRIGSPLLHSMFAVKRYIMLHFYWSTAKPPLTNESAHDA